MNEPGTRARRRSARLCVAAAATLWAAGCGGPDSRSLSGGNSGNVVTPLDAGAGDMAGPAGPAARCAEPEGPVHAAPTRADVLSLIVGTWYLCSHTGTGLGFQDAAGIQITQTSWRILVRDVSGQLVPQTDDHHGGELGVYESDVVQESFGPIPIHAAFEDDPRRMALLNNTRPDAPDLFVPLP